MNYKYGRPELTDLSDTEVSDSLHIDQIAYRDPGSATEAENSLAEFEELENQLNFSGDINYDDVLAEIDEGVKHIESVRRQTPRRDSNSPFSDLKSLSDVSDHIQSAQSDFIYEDKRTDDEYIEDSYTRSNYSEDENEVQRQPDLDYEEMLDELESHVHSDSDRESVISSKRSSPPLSTTLHNHHSSSLKRLDGPLTLHNRPHSRNVEQFSETMDTNLSRSKSQPKLSKSGPSQAATTSLSPIGKQNKWASMPWLAREPSFASSITSDVSSHDREYRNKYRSERQDHKTTVMAYTDLQDEFTNQAKELAEAKQTIDQLRLGATIDLYGKPPEPGKLIQGTLPQSFEQSAFNPPKVIQQHALPKPNIIPDSDTLNKQNHHSYDDNDYDEVRPSTLKRRVPLNDTPATPQTPFLGRDHNDDTVIDLRNSGSTLVMDSTDLDLSGVDDADDDVNDEMQKRADLLRQDLIDKIAGVDDSIHNYEELVCIDQINLDERDNALRNLEDNTRKLERDYTKAKSEVGDTLLDVDNSLSGEIIRIGRELSDLKRALEQDELNSRKYATSAASVKTKSSAETQISTGGRNRSVSPSRIPVAPQAELYRRSSQKALKTTQPATKPATKKTDEKSKKPKSKNGSIVGDRGKSVNPTSLADSGFVSSRAAAGNRSAEPRSLDSSTKALNQNFSELEARRARRQQQQQRKPEPKPMVVHASPPPPSTKRERRPSSSKSVRKSSFGVSATPSVRTSETQTEQQQQQQAKPVRRYASMNDVRKSRKTQMVDNSMTTSLTESEDSLTDAETVVHRRPHRRRSQSPKRRSHESLSKPTKIDFVEPPPPPTPINSAAELDVLRGEIMRLKEEMERREQPRPIIKSPVQSDNESKQVKLFSRLKNEVQKLRDEVMKVKSKKSDVDSSSVLDTDSTYQTDVQSTRHSTRNLQHNRQPAHVQPNLQYIPYTEMPSGVLMPMWVLPNKKGMIHAASVPNLTVPLKESRRSQAYRIEPVESDGHTTDVDYRSRKKRPGRFHPVDTVMVYDDELDKKLRKAERAADKVNDRSNRLMRKARHKTYSTAFYGYV